MEITSAKQLGNLIRNQRNALHFTQEVLAEKAGVSRLWINQVERGKENASFLLILRTLNALDLSLNTVSRNTGRDQLNMIFDNR